MVRVEQLPKGAAMSNGELAKKLQITGATVCKWRERFRVNRLEGDSQWSQHARTR